MRHGIATCLFLLAAGTAQADITEVTRVLKDTTTIVAVPLNEQTVFCTDRGYGNVQLKISVPDLDWLAHFDHRVVGEAQPCITGGECVDGNGPDSILDPAHPVEAIPVRVVLKETLLLDDAQKTCTRHLYEEVSSLVRRKRFEHYRWGDQETPVPYEQCLAVVGL